MGIFAPHPGQSSTPSGNKSAKSQPHPGEKITAREMKTRVMPHLASDIGRPKAHLVDQVAQGTIQEKGRPQRSMDYGEKEQVMDTLRSNKQYNHMTDRALNATDEAFNHEL